MAEKKEKRVAEKAKKTKEKDSEKSAKKTEKKEKMEKRIAEKAGEKKTEANKEKIKRAEKKIVGEIEEPEEKEKTQAKKETEKIVKKTERKWVELKPAEIEEAIISLANAGHTASEIGMILRDQYGVPKVKAVAKKTLTQILKQNNLLGEIPEDLLSLIRKSVRLKAHLQKNKKDMSAKRGYQLAVSKIRRLAKYYAKKNRLPKGWRFSEEEAELLVK